MLIIVSEARCPGVRTLLLLVDRPPAAAPAPHPDLEIVPGDDHSLYTADGRARAYPLLVRWLLTRFGPDGAGPIS